MSNQKDTVGLYLFCNPICCLRDPFYTLDEQKQVCRIGKRMQSLGYAFAGTNHISFVPLCGVAEDFGFRISAFGLPVRKDSS